MNVWVDANGWPVPPVLLFGCLILEYLYFRGWNVILRSVEARETRKATRTRKPLLEQIWFWRGIFFASALVVMLLNSSAPVDYYAGRLLWVHMIQHLLLLGLIAPLLVAGAPLLPLWLGLPRKGRRVFKTVIALPVRRGAYLVSGWLRQPALTLVLFVLGIWVWHWPSLYDLALSNGLIHDWGEHTTFLAVSLLFWSQLIPSPPLHQRAGTAGRLVLVAGAIAQNIVLAMLIGFATTPIYASYAHLAAGAAGPLSALQDQQIAAGIMWTFGDLPFGITFATIIHRWLASIMDEEVQPVPVRSGS